MQRLGLCCQFAQAPIKFRTTTVRYVSTLGEKGKNHLEYIGDLITENLNNLLLAVDFCADNEIGAFRINSDLLPIYTHPEWGYSLDDLLQKKAIYAGFDAVKKQARLRKIRLSFHPDQYVVLNSPKEKVVTKSIADLEYHGVMAKLVGADVINIHGGGGYGDKAEALRRFAKNFKRLSADVQKSLTVENDDRTFTPEDLLPLCKELAIPLVYDVHHHRCLPDNLTVAQATEKALQTWNREPLFHLSSPKEGWEGPKPRLHHDFIHLDDVPQDWKELDPLTIDIEAKAKELAVLRLQRQLTEKKWTLEW